MHSEMVEAPVGNCQQRPESPRKPTDHQRGGGQSGTMIGGAGLGGDGNNSNYRPRSFVVRHRKAILIGSAFLTLGTLGALIGILVKKPWEYDSSKDTGGNGHRNSTDEYNNGKRNSTNSGSSPVPDRFTESSQVPISSTVQCNPNTPPLDQPFPYGKQPIRGVNLGGWLVLEPFITPSVFEPYIPQQVTDEYSLTKLLGPEKAKAYLQKHYSTWVTEDTFKQIRNLGLNHVRIPVGFWALGNLQDDEPYVPDLSLNYLLQGLKWAAKYGIRVMVELHAAPGSQNGWNHSGRGGKIGWMDGTEQGQRNGQRTLEYTKQFVKLLHGPGMEHVSPMYGILNEPAIFMLERERIDEWYKEAFADVRNITGSGRGPWAVLHDGFLGLTQWEGFMHGADHLALDVHQYLIFDQSLISLSRKDQANFPCDVWSQNMQRSSRKFGPTVVGEFSSATNDCATYLNGVGVGYRWNGTFINDNGVADPAACQPAKNGNIAGYCSCEEQNRVGYYTPEYRKFLSDFTQTQMDAFEQGLGWFYWNFKTETNALWSYFDGVEQGWIPKDINNRPGGCTALGHPIISDQGSSNDD